MQALLEKERGVATKEATFEEMKVSDEKISETAYSYEIIGEECDENKAIGAYTWRYCPYLQGWRGVGGRSSMQEKSTGWRFGVYVIYRGEVVHCGGLVYKTFAEATEAIPGATKTVLWSKDLEGNEYIAAPFLDEETQREAYEPLYGVGGDD